MVCQSALLGQGSYRAGHTVHESDPVGFLAKVRAFLGAL
ncbi:hypothetical protein SYYSPA8_20960 [Streptomyces yaizuensis]|uniref:Uncharacterized protein n=1 Tax=Streptomyces yaizuensis TaxID=2989713 RepID=A0ABQ5P2J5_9ACTN|nr:hypothetical protein SYYSPA8_20960 [Streptomyces sp. YSPA8]